MVTHFDRCLGCMACVTACPSGVRYDRLIERVRPQVERHHRRARGPSARCAGCCTRRSPIPGACGRWCRCWPLGRKLGVEQRLPDRLAMMAKVAPRAPAETAACRSGLTPAVGEPRGRVGLLLGCVQRVFYPGVHRGHDPRPGRRGVRGPRPAAARLLRGARVARRRRGAGAAPSARRRSRAFAQAGGAGLDHIVVNAAGCGSAMKEYGELLGTPEAAGVLGPRPRRRPSCWPRSSPGPRAARCRCGSPTTTPAIWPTPRASAPSLASCCAAIPALELVEVGVRARAVLRLGRDLQPASSPRRRPSSARARPGT